MLHTRVVDGDRRIARGGTLRRRCLTPTDTPESGPDAGSVAIAMKNIAAVDASVSVMRLRVLIAEPDDDARHHYAQALRLLGCDAIEASDGREALIEALVRRPSVIVMESRL